MLEGASAAARVKVTLPIQLVCIFVLDVAQGRLILAGSGRDTFKPAIAACCCACRTRDRYRQVPQQQHDRHSLRARPPVVLLKICLKKAIIFFSAATPSILSHFLSVGWASNGADFGHRHQRSVTCDM
jgi:hypothetical protein